MLNFVRDLFSTPVKVKDVSELRVGKVIVTGRVKAGEEMLLSPVRATECVAFSYRSTWRAPARGRSTVRPLRVVEAYAPRFAVELGEEEVAVVAPSDEHFGPEDHRAAAHASLDGFKAIEQLIRPGDRIRIHGKARQDGEEWVVIPVEVELVEVQPVRTRRQRRRR